MGRNPEAGNHDRVAARTEKTIIPTYTISRGLAAPAIFELEETRGAYPRTVLDIGTRSEKPVEREYELAVLESSLLRVEVLPEVGGRVWRIIDKTSGRNLLWTNDVIKPVDVGRRHGWIEGSIEFPFPVSNHGEDTIEPYRHAMRENGDGSATVTVWSLDRFYRFWGSYDITVAPGDLRVAITVRLYNPTLVRNRYQIWINGAVPASDDMQFVFPVDYIAGHGFVGVRPWPMWDDNAYDRSFWRNQKEMLGVFGWNADFLGVYYHDSDCGTIRFCRHSEAEGIKAWTWGTDSRWDGELTDKGGPCVEIQWGRWPTQKMYGWLEPHQMDTWTEYWYPVRGLGGVDQATEDAAMSVKVSKDADAFRSAEVRVYSLKPIKGRLVVRAAKKMLLSKKVSASAGETVKAEARLAGVAAGDRLSVSLIDDEGRVVMSHERALAGSRGEEPQAPESVSVRGTGPSWEALRSALSAELLDGDQDRALQEYRSIVENHADFAPAWKAMGILLYKQADAEAARDALCRAVELAGDDAEARYYLALAKIDIGESGAANALGIAAKEGRFAHLAEFVAGIEAMKTGDYAAAVGHLEKAAGGSGSDPVAWDYMAVAARLAGDAATAGKAIEAALEAEPLDPFAMTEELLATGSASHEEIAAALGADEDLYIETALFYDAVNQNETALQTALAGVERASSALYYYQLAYLSSRTGDGEGARRFAAKGDAMGTDFVFPHRREDLRILELAGGLNGKSGYAKYHEGTLFYWLGQSGKALGLWEGMLGRYKVPGLYHKVAEAYSMGKVARAHEAAIDMYRKALEEDGHNVEAYYALDELYEKTSDIHNRRDVLERGRELFPEDDQMAIRSARYWSWRRQYSKAAGILEGHRFHRRHQSWQMMATAQRAIEDTYAGLAMEAARKGHREEALAHIGRASAAREQIKEWFD